ncbi:MAG: AtpZ/AtpI family protein [Candidatus Falkowbacteria bacterium]
MDSKETREPKTIRQLALSVLAYNAASILGPLLGFGAIGFFLDYRYGTKPLFIVIGVATAFLTTNIFLVKRISRMIRSFEIKTIQENKKTDKDNSKNINRKKDEAGGDGNNDYHDNDNDSDD